jgi:hypothetical protein
MTPKGIPLADVIKIRLRCRRLPAPTRKRLCCGCMAISRETLATIGKVIAGISGVMTPIVIFWLGRRKARRSLVFSYRSLIIARAGHNPDPRFRLTFLGTEIRAASSVEVTVTNNGGETIREDEFRGPIEFVFPGAENVLDFDMFGPFQVGEEPRTRYLNNHTRAVNGWTITTDPVLLNSGDKILLAAQIGNFKDSLRTVSGTADSFGDSRSNPHHSEQ